MTLIEELWRDLLEKDDRTSLEDYPDMALITFEEFAGYIGLAAARLPDSPSAPQDEPDPLLKLVPVEPTEEMVERVARIIDPNAWARFENRMRTSNWQDWPMLKKRYCTQSRTTARAILAMLNAVPTIPGGGGSSRTNLECDGERAATERRRDLDAELNRRLSNALENYARDNNLTMGEVAEAARSLLITPETEVQRKSDGDAS